MAVVVVGAKFDAEEIEVDEFLERFVTLSDNETSEADDILVFEFVELCLESLAPTGDVTCVDELSFGCGGKLLISIGLDDEFFIWLPSIVNYQQLMIFEACNK